MLNSNATWNDGAKTDLPSRGSQVATDNATTQETPFSFASQKVSFRKQAWRRQKYHSLGSHEKAVWSGQWNDFSYGFSWPALRWTMITNHFPTLGMRVRGWKKDVFRKHRFKYPIPIFRWYTKFRWSLWSSYWNGAFRVSPANERALNNAINPSSGRSVP